MWFGVYICKLPKGRCLLATIVVICQYNFMWCNFQRDRDANFKAVSIFLTQFPGFARCFPGFPEGEKSYPRFVFEFIENHEV